MLSLPYFKHGTILLKCNKNDFFLFLHFSFFFFKNIWSEKNLQNYTSGAVGHGVRGRRRTVP
jgi:hypothetical protein